MLHWDMLTRSERTRLYGLLQERIQCGPFDGGCLVVARALQRVMGDGDIHVLIGRGVAQHAVLSWGGMLIDAAGPRTPQKMLARFSKTELVEVTTHRMMLPGDVPEAPCTDELVLLVVAALPADLPSRIQGLVVPAPGSIKRPSRKSRL